MSTSRLMLADLPQFAVLSAEFGDANQAKIAGRFSSNRFVDGLRPRNGRRRLYISLSTSLIGDFRGFDPPSLAAVFETYLDQKQSGPGQTFPFLDSDG